MSYAQLRLDIRDGIATITLNRPEAYNALNMQLATELHDAVLTCSEDEAVRVVVLTGSGRAFCAGGDVKGFVEHLDTIGKHIQQLTVALHAAVSRLVRMPKPTITAVNGVAAGGGMSLSLAGDLIVAAKIEIPKRLNGKQEKLLRDFAATEDQHVMPESHGFWKKIKDAVGG